MGDEPAGPREAPKWRPEESDGGIDGPLVDSTPEALRGDVSSAVSGSAIRAGYTRWDGELAGERPATAGGAPGTPPGIQPAAPYVPGSVPAGPVAPYLPGPGGPVAPPPYGGVPAAPYGAPPPPPYRPPAKGKSNVALIVTVVATVIVLIIALGVWGAMRGFQTVKGVIGDAITQDFVIDALEQQHAYFSANNRYATASQLGAQKNASPRPIQYVEAAPRAGAAEVRVALDGTNTVCLSARSESGFYWAIGEIAKDGSRATYYLEDEFTDPLEVCGPDTITVGRKGGFPSGTPTSRSTRR